MGEHTKQAGQGTSEGSTLNSSRISVERPATKRDGHFEGNESAHAILREKYLFAFRNAMLFGKCAGTVTELPLLHRATLTLEEREIPQEDQANALRKLGNVQRKKGNIEQAITMYNESLKISRAINNRHLEAKSLNNLGLCAKVRGDLEEAVRYHRESLAIKRVVGDRQGEAISLNNLGNIELARGAVEEATRLIETSLVIKREIGDKKGEATSMMTIGEIAKKRNDFISAAAVYKEVHSISRKVGDLQLQSFALSKRMEIAALQGDSEKAKRLEDQLLAIREQYALVHSEPENDMTATTLVDAELEYDALFDEITRANEHVTKNVRKAQRSPNWDSISDRPWIRENLTKYIIGMRNETFKIQSLNIINLEKEIKLNRLRAQENEQNLGSIPKADYFRVLGALSEQMIPLVSKKQNLEKLCNYTAIREEFRSDAYPIIYGRPWSDQSAPENYEELMLAMETSTQHHATRVLRIFGDPGQGKSTLLQQLGYDFATNQLINHKDHMPYYFKAKHISRLRTSGLSEEALGTMQEIDKDVILDDFRADEIADALFESEADLKQYITKEEIIQLIRLERQDPDAKPRCIFIDALDECSTLKDQEYVREFINNEVENFHSNVIVTCRTTHRHSLEIETNNAYTCLLHYTEEELRREMPKKLSDAWGINRDMLTLPTELYFDKYQSVLSHPLYVGWFCFLLRNDKLHVTEQPDIEIMQGDSALNELHIAFLKQVIEVGIEISISEKYPTKIDEFDQGKILDLFCLIAANYFTMNTQNLDVILTRIVRVHPTITITKLEEDFIRNNMGLLFVNDEHALEFTHETLPEVALGIIFEDSRYADEYLPKSAEESGLMHRRDLINSSAWSQCIVLTRAVLRRNRGDGSLKSCIIDLLPSVPGPFIEQTIGMLTVNKGPIISIQNDGLYPYIHQEKVQPSQDEIILYEVGQKYIDSIEKSERFPLNWPERFHNSSSSDHPVDVIYQHTTIFDCSDLLITTNSLMLMQYVSLSSASRILELWTDEGEIDNPILLQWYLGHIQHGSFNNEFEDNLLHRLTWDGQRKIQSNNLDSIATRLIFGLEYCLSRSAVIHEHGAFAGNLFGSRGNETHQRFLNHILSPVQQNQDIDLIFLVEMHGERLRKSLLKSSELLSNTIYECMISNPPIRQGKQMNKNTIRMHIARILEIPSVSNALLQYFAAILWFHCKHPEISLIQRGASRADQVEVGRFWRLFEQNMGGKHLDGKKVLAVPHPINIIYSNSKKVPEVLLNLMDILLPYIGTDARNKIFVDLANVKMKHFEKKNKFHFKNLIGKMFEKDSTISGTYKREQND
jgi:tetratricopeptide (TPR) repeat protein/archaellum biogenesis ATPase FlaH